MERVGGGQTCGAVTNTSFVRLTTAWNRIRAGGANTVTGVPRTGVPDHAPSRPDAPRSHGVPALVTGRDKVRPNTLHRNHCGRPSPLAFIVTTWGSAHTMSIKVWDA